MHFPVDKTAIYKYHADVKTGLFEPAPYASQFVLDAELYVKKDVRDPTLTHAYYVQLQDVKYGMYNGMTDPRQTIKSSHDVGEDAMQIQEPFLIVYDESGKVSA